MLDGRTGAVEGWTTSRVTRSSEFDDCFSRSTTFTAARRTSGVPPAGALTSACPGSSGAHVASQTVEEPLGEVPSRTSSSYAFADTGHAAGVSCGASNGAIRARARATPPGTRRNQSYRETSGRAKLA